MICIDLDFKIDYTFKEETVLCLGMFDGLHLGHQELISRAKKEGKKVALLAFKNSPKQFIRQEEVRFLTPNKDKITFLESLGVDIFLLKTFNESFCNITKEKFVDSFLKRLKPFKLCVGFDYRFGQNKEGTPEFLKDYFNVIEVPPFNLDQRKVSSSRVFNALQGNDIQDVTNCLGRYYFIEGKVEKGLGNGKKLHFPTANILPTDKYVLPGAGVYSGIIFVDNQMFKTMINIGTHPTIDEVEHNVIEAHILDFDADIYDKIVRLYFTSFIRKEKRFDNIDALCKKLTENKKEVYLLDIDENLLK
ncbi:MAG: bifunctional riboflavin kinase/FAD synthetase [Bacilli bacterium]|nr:bifunctional riboflavin kinase/FAD synthetase [Bacilli bacterium]